MAVSVEWEIKGTEFANYNCAYGCGCQFNALPDKGFCEAVAGYQIQQGNFGDVRLDGLRAAAIPRQRMYSRAARTPRQVPIASVLSASAQRPMIQ